MRPYYQGGGITIYHGRMEEVMPDLDLSGAAFVLTDPPHGIGIQEGRRTSIGNPGERKRVGRSAVGNPRAPATCFPSKITGDFAPYSPPAFLAAMLDSCASCLWGANHFADALPRSAGWLVWDKKHRGGESRFADAELAWTNFSGTVRIFRHYWNGMLRDSERGPRVHPMQKPVALMKWVINLAKLRANSLIVDPYTGSGPVLRAAKDLGHRAIGIDNLEWCCERAAQRCSQDVLPLEASGGTA